QLQYLMMVNINEEKYCGGNIQHYLGRIKYLLTPGCTESDWIPFRNSCYLFSHDTMNWTKAKDYCEEKGALLLKIEAGSEKEWQFVTNFAKPHDYWVGLTDQNTGQWRWNWIFRFWIIESDYSELTFMTKYKQIDMIHDHILPYTKCLLFII
uniref:C-type lectin domain-containing protein n=1 Tax=Sinocyclocheilus anshuiensis TaxID=1608454 RepID=A0A671LAE1_9TELE